MLPFFLFLSKCLKIILHEKFWQKILNLAYFILYSPFWKMRNLLRTAGTSVPKSWPLALPRYISVCAHMIVLHTIFIVRYLGHRKDSDGKLADPSNHLESSSSPLWSRTTEYMQQSFQAPLSCGYIAHHHYIYFFFFFIRGWVNLRRMNFWENEPLRQKAQ